MFYNPFNCGWSNNQFEQYLILFNNTLSGLFFADGSSQFPEGGFKILLQFWSGGS
jgi:hypothetical protein